MLLESFKVTKLKKITVTHPVTGTERKFDATIYEPFKAAILQSLKGTKGKTFSELTDRSGNKRPCRNFYR